MRAQPPQQAAGREPCGTQTILITGASSGVGAALALEYASPGVRLVLTGRDAKRLNEVAGRCAEKGANVETQMLDIRDAAAVKEWIDAVDDAAPVDLAIANAGIAWTPETRDDFDANTRTIFAVNVDGVFNTVHPLLERMQGRGRGQIALMSSLAGFRGMPGTAAYSASKAAVKSYGEALRAQMRGVGIEISIICPGFIRTPLTADNKFPMPFLMDADRSARIIRGGLAKNRERIAFPWRLYAIVWWLDSMPSRLVDLMFRIAFSKA